MDNCTPKTAMNPEQFRQVVILLFGDHRGWQSRCADSLGIDRSSITRYLSTGPSNPVAVALYSWLDRYHRTGERPWRKIGGEL